MAGHLGWTRLLLLCGCLVTGGAVAQDAPVDLGDGPAATLGVVALPEDPSADEVASYIQQIAEATAVLPRDPRRDDPQAALLERLADHHLDELVQAHETHPQLRYYLDPIIQREIARRGGPDVSRLASIKLIADASESEAWSYVLDIARVSAGQRRVSSNDPQVTMLQALADKHMPVLIDAIEIEDLRFYALLAVRSSVNEDHKQAVIAALPDQPRLIGVVRQQEWAGDARDQLIAGLENGTTIMPRTWVQVVVELRDAATYDALMLQLVRSRCSRTYYSLMQDLPGIDLAPAVHAAWEQVAYLAQDPREVREVAQIAVGYGRADALAHLVGLLPSDEADASGYESDVRQAVLNHIEFSGTNAQIKAWHDENRTRLRFSTSDRRFYRSGLLQ